MMISNFLSIKINKYKWIVFFLIFINSLALAESDKFQWVCNTPGLACTDKNDQCTLYAVNEKKEKKLILVSDRRGMCRTTINDLSNVISAVVTSCGSYCSSSVFYDFDTRMIVSYPDVLAVQPHKKLVIYLKNLSVFLSYLFKEETPQEIINKKDLSHMTAFPIDSIEGIKFEENKVIINYIDNRNKIAKKIIYIS